MEKKSLEKSDMGIKRVYSFSLSLDILFSFEIFFFFSNHVRISIDTMFFQTIFPLLETHKSYLLSC